MLTKFGENEHREIIYMTKNYSFEISGFNGSVSQYVIIVNLKNNYKEIRIAISKPIYIDKTKFSKKELDDILYLLNSNIERDFGLIEEIPGEIHPIIFKGRLWDCIVWFWNDYYPKYHISKYTKMPDYSKLETI